MLHVRVFFRRFSHYSSIKNFFTPQGQYFATNTHTVRTLEHGTLGRICGRSVRMTDEKHSPKQEFGSQQPKQQQSSHQQDRKPGLGSQQQESKRDPKKENPQKSERGSSEGVSEDRDERLDPSKDRKAS
jgi:hypothetical protein